MPFSHLRTTQSGILLLCISISFIFSTAAKMPKCGFIGHFQLNNRKFLFCEMTFYSFINALFRNRLIYSLLCMRSSLSRKSILLTLFELIRKKFFFVVHDFLYHHFRSEKEECFLSLHTRLVKPAIIATIIITFTGTCCYYMPEFFYCARIFCNVLLRFPFSK